MQDTLNHRWIAFRIVVALGAGIGAAACGSDPEPAAAESEQSSGDEKPLGAVDEAHEDFKEEVKPVASEVDRVAKESVAEGKKAAQRTADAVGDAFDGDDESDGKADDEAAE